MWNFKIIYIYMNLYINSNLNKNIIKFKIILLLDSIGDYMTLILKKCLYKKMNLGTINKLKYIISVKKVIVSHNV
jgi:hypothetical protein